MRVWITVPPKTVQTDGGPMVVPDYPTYYQVKPRNADGTFEVLVDDPSAK